MIVTIDGPSGSGKSTAAKALAGRLGFEYLDTGAMFRAVALGLLRGGVPTADAGRVSDALRGISLNVRPGVVRLNGEDVTALIRTREVTDASSRIAVIPSVREHLAGQQRAAAAGHNIICEGRDQGTAVFPEAECKFFLTAAAEVRARRRHRELADRGEAITLDEVMRQQRERDRRDSERAMAPLRPADNAVEMDTSEMPLGEVIDRMEREIRRCRGG